MTDLVSTTEVQAPTFWETAAATRWGQYVSEAERRVILQAHMMAGPPSTALEVGCDGGRWSSMLAQHGWQMTCTDISSHTLQVCQSKIPSAKCILVMPEESTVPCDTASQSLLLCVEVAPVIQSEWFVSEASRSLRFGGFLVGMFWNLSSLRGWSVHAKSRLLGRQDIFYRKRYKDFRRSLLARGFQVVHEEGLCWAPFGRTSNSPLIPFFTALEAASGLNRLTTWSPWVMFIARKNTP